jgi:hypothetical protein
MTRGEISHELILVVSEASRIGFVEYPGKYTRPSETAYTIERT